MRRQRMSSGSQYEQPMGFSRAVRIGPMIAVSGTAPIGPDGAPAFPGDVYNQTKLCIEIMLRAITDAGGTPEGVIRTRIFLSDINQWSDAARAHGEVFGIIRPATTMVQVSAFIDPAWLVETEADCFVIER